MALKKKKSGGGGANWMDTYGDMVTLLLCFFVLLYSMSTISQDKWKAIVMSFNPSAVQDPNPVINGNDGPIADPGENGMMPDKAQEEIDEDIEALFQAIQQYIQESNQQSTITASKDGGKIYISFGNTVFFDGESAYLRKEATPVLESISEMLSAAAESIEEVRVLGHTAQGTPGKPNRVEWDRTLSSQRAANVVIFIQEHSDVAPGKLISEGIGQWRPVATNDTAEGRAKNRRVEMIISGRDLQMEAAGVTTYYTTQ
mgnify:CR=1 FL=1